MWQLLSHFIQFGETTERTARFCIVLFQHDGDVQSGFNFHYRGSLAGQWRTTNSCFTRDAVKFNIIIIIHHQRRWADTQRDRCRRGIPDLISNDASPNSEKHCYFHLRVNSCSHHMPGRQSGQVGRSIPLFLCSWKARDNQPVQWCSHIMVCLSVRRESIRSTWLV